MAINYDDSRLTEVETDKKAALTDVENTYGDMIDQSDSHYQKQIDAVQEYADKQAQIQQQQSDLAIQQIEQQKAQAEKDYTKEQSGAYVDWQKQSNPYGANAEQMASAGLNNSGYSESSQVSMYNTYQNRVATAREAFTRAILNYDNAIEEARLQNSSILAEIAYNALQQQLELALQSFQYKNSLVIEQANKKMEIDEIYHNRYQDVLNQINTENALAEEVRQYNASLAHQQALLAFQQEQFEYQKQQDAKAAATAKSAAARSRQYATTVGKTNKAKKAVDKTLTNEANAMVYLNKLIASGASKDKVANEISIALREGAISKSEATKLRNTFTPRGVAY